MSLKKAGQFIHLLLTTSKEQSKALLHTLTPSQTRAICEIFFNLQHLRLATSVNKELLKRRRVIRKLIDKSVSPRTKNILIQNHHKQVLTSLLLVKKDLLKLVQ